TAAWAHVDAAGAKRAEALKGVQPALIERRKTYDSLAAAEQGGGGQGPSQTASQAGGAVAAIPIVESVIGRASQVLAEVEPGLVSPSEQSEVGYSMALMAYPEVVLDFVTCYYQLRGLKADFTARRQKW